MAYIKRMTDKEAETLVRMAIRPLCRSEDTRERLTKHLFLLQNKYAVQLAEMLRDSMENGKAPDFEQSRVMEEMFGRAVEIIVEDPLPTSPVRGRRRVKREGNRSLTY